MRRDDERVVTNQFDLTAGMAARQNSWSKVLACGTLKPSTSTKEKQLASENLGIYSKITYNNI